MPAENQAPTAITQEGLSPMSDSSLQPVWSPEETQRVLDEMRNHVAEVGAMAVVR